jgi:hypothetical protein
MGPVVSAASLTLKKDLLTIQMDQTNIRYSFGMTQRRDWESDPKRIIAYSSIKFSDILVY